ncbi:hypothetical protein E2C01_091662 [Portunus trituberculatus]|uniref:Uncharacterized protein n=1 Tax=Portunus trituberculatus TaxID=210409 RepID=A0A5B7JVN4_PORTR|nr:hypothetical protein [Portunus trituberculatus]
MGVGVVPLAGVALGREGGGHGVRGTSVEFTKGVAGRLLGRTGAGRRHKVTRGERRTKPARRQRRSGHNERTSLLPRRHTSTNFLPYPHPAAPSPSTTPTPCPGPTTTLRHKSGKDGAVQARTNSTARRVSPHRPAPRVSEQRGGASGRKVRACGWWAAVVSICQRPTRLDSLFVAPQSARS